MGLAEDVRYYGAWMRQKAQDLADVGGFEVERHSGLSGHSHLAGVLELFLNW